MNWRRKIAIAIAVVVVSAAGLVAPGFDVAAAQTVGMVTKVQNQAQVGGQAAAVGSPVRLNDTLQTGANARLQVTFRDNTNLTLGENATVVVDRFVFDPDAGVGEATLNATKGAFRMVTGRISDMPNKDITVKTSFGAVAVRGTDFWSGSVSGQTGVLLVHNSRSMCVATGAPKTPTEMTEGVAARLPSIRPRKAPTSIVARAAPCFHASGLRQR